MDIPRIYKVSFASVYPHYVTKAERKGRTKTEVDTIITWLTGYDRASLAARLADDTTVETFFTSAPRLNPARRQITGVICGVRVEDIQEPVMQEIRYLDKLIDELAKGKAMDKILRPELIHTALLGQYQCAKSACMGHHAGRHHVPTVVGGD